MLTDSNTLTALRQHHLFGKLPAAAFHEVCGLAIFRRLDGGDILFHQGDVADRFYLLLDGQMKLTRVLPEGHEKLVEVIHAGQSFAEALLFSGAPNYPVSASALKGSSLVSIDGSHYRRILEEQPKICLDLLATFSIRLHQRLNEIETLSLKNATHRVVRYFLAQLAQLPDGETRIELPVTKQLVAGHLSIQPETFSRIIRRLSDEGIIDLDGRQITVLDRARLEQFE